MAAPSIDPNVTNVEDALAPRLLTEWDPPEARKRTKHDESHDAFSSAVEYL